MKNRKKLLLAVLCLIVLLSVVLSCSKQTGDAQADPTSSAEELPAVFEKPELPETDELNIYMEKTNKTRMKIAIRAFEELYPDVNLNVEELGQDEYTARLRVEIPAGDGPDAVWGVDTFFPDIYKTIASKIFTDLTPYFKTDEDFNCDDYIPATWTSGVLKGKQYVVPLQFELGVLITTEEILAENGISQEGLETYDGFLDACLTFHQNHPDKELFDFGANTHFFNSLVLNTHTRFLEPDPDDETYPFTQENLKRLLEVSKAWCPGNSTDYIFENMGEPGLLAKDFLFMEMILTPGAAVMNMADLKDMRVTPIMVYVNNPYDKNLATGFDFMAIPAGAKNKLNAYRFVKLTLSYDYQSDTKGYLNITPVMKKALEDNMVSRLDQFIDDETFYHYVHDKILNTVDEIDEIDFVRGYSRSAMYENIIEPYLKGETGFDKMYQKLDSFLTIYRDE